MPSHTLRTLPTASINKFAHLLQTLPHERGLGYSERIAHSVKHLPSELKHRSRLSNLLSTNVPAPIVEARLCLLHKSLSTALMHEIFTLISLEVGHNCNSLTQHNTWLTPAQHDAIHRLRELHSLWLPAETYKQTFLEEPNPTWPHQRSGCEGCILTRIGSHLEVVTELRTLLMSRRRTLKPQKGRPTLLGFVDGWLIGLVGDGQRGRELMQGSEMEGEELKITRKKIWRERQEKRRLARRKESQDLVEKGDSEEMEQEKETQEEQMGKEAYDSDFEGEIIDHYAVLRSTLYQPLQSSPAKTPSLTTGSSARTLSTHPDISETPQSSTLGRPKASSIYSYHQSNEALPYEPPRRGEAWHGQKSAGTQAQDYRNLLTPPSVEPFSRSQPVKERESRHEQQQHHHKSPRLEERVPRSGSMRKKDRPQVGRKQQHQYSIPPPEEPVSRSKAPATNEDSRRQTTWSQFSLSHNDDPKPTRDNTGTAPRFYSMVQSEPEPEPEPRPKPKTQGEGVPKPKLPRPTKVTPPLPPSGERRMYVPSCGPRQTRWPFLSPGTRLRWRNGGVKAVLRS